MLANIQALFFFPNPYGDNPNFTTYSPSFLQTSGLLIKRRISDREAFSHGGICLCSELRAAEILNVP